MQTVSERTKSFFAGILILLFSLFFFTPKLFSGEKESNKSRPAAAPAVPNGVQTDVFVVRPTAIHDELQTTGTVAARQEAALVSEVARKVIGVYAREGQYVRQGTLLFKLDDADLRAKKRKLALQEKLALLDEKRFRELLATESVNQQEYDQISTNLKVIQAEIGMLDVDLAKTEIRAPFSGKIGLNRVDVGAYVTPSVILTSLQDISQVEVNFTVPEKYASEIRPGQVIHFTTENATHTLQGRIKATEPATDLNTRSLLVKALSTNRDGRLVPGTSAKIGLSLHTTQNGILVPTQALIPTQKGYSVYVLEGGKAGFRPVKTGNRAKGTVQILEGISLGDTVITTNILRLEAGVPVRIAGIQ